MMPSAGGAALTVPADRWRSSQRFRWMQVLGFLERLDLCYPPLSSGGQNSTATAFPGLPAVVLVIHMSCTKDPPVSCDPPRVSSGPRIFVDCTQTIKTHVSTGIPRVVTNIVKHGRPAARQRGAELIPVRFNGQHFVNAAISPDGDLVRAKKRNATHRQEHPLLHRLRKLLVPRTLVRFFEKKAGKIFSGPQVPVQISAGDVLLLPDSSWTERIWETVDRALANGAILGVVQHDFIPLRYPNLVPAENTAIFRRWTNETLRRAHFIMAVSRAVAAEARIELTKLGRREVAEHCVTAFRNGADLPAPSGKESIRKELIDFVGPAGNAPYLTVGTIEPRKNQMTLLAAIDRVLQSAPDARFLLAGIVGWRGKPIVESMHRHPGWQRNIRHFPDLTDTELRFAYKHAKAVVFPSLAEGYGLPIVESLANGTRVFASNIPVHCEIGTPYCVFFDPQNPAQLADVLIADSLHGEYAANWPPADYELPSWREAANEIVATSISYAHRCVNDRN